MRGLKDPTLSAACLIAEARGVTLDTLVKQIEHGRAKVIDPALSAKISEGVKFRNKVKQLMEEGLVDAD